MGNKNIFFVFIIIIFFLTGFYLLKGNFSKNLEISQIQYVKIGEIKLKVDLAVTREEHQQGLSGRLELKKDEGMLFVFDNEGQYPFWMKDMNFPIDIIWITDDLKIVFIKKNALPESYPETFISDTNARYVLEVLSSFSEKNNLKIGDRVEFLPS